MSMELLVAVDDYCVTKVTLTAAVAGVNINVVKGLSHSDLMKFDYSTENFLGAHYAACANPQIYR
jgi:hypothetical protein